MGIQAIIILPSYYSKRHFMLALSPRGAVSSIECFSSPKKELVVILVLDLVVFLPDLGVYHCT